MAVSQITFSSIGIDTGSSSTDHITNDSSLTITGTVVGSGRVNFQYSGDGGASWTTFDSLTLNGNGFNVSTPVLSDGTYIIRASSPSTTTTATYIIDTTAPAVSNIVVSGDGIVAGTDEHNFTVSGSVADANSGTVQVQIYDGANLLTTASGSYSGGVFSVNVAGLTLPTSGNYSVKVSATDLAGNTIANPVTQTFTSTACFMPGTRIATPQGERAVEELAIGDMVLTHEGRAAPIRWIGRKTVSLVFADKLRTVPVRVRAGALGENVPVRDLLLSPDHALMVAGVLVQAGALVNGTTIVRETNVPSSFVYYHVELADHALILAEGTPAETFIDNVDRMAFDNWAEHERLYGAAPGLVEMDLPRAKSHRQLPAEVRALVAARAEALAADMAVAA